MKQVALLIIMAFSFVSLCLAQARAQSVEPSEPQILHLPGNTRVIVSPSQPVYVFKDRFDERDIVRFMVNPKDGWRSVYVRQGDESKACLGYERRRDRRQCLKDLKNQQEEREKRR